MDIKEDVPVLKFSAVHRNGSRRTHQIEVALESYNELLEDKNLNDKQKVKYAMVGGDLRVKCTCEDFLFKGFAYMGTQLEYSLMEEDRFPSFRNPKLEGTVCKHCLSVVTKLNLFYNNTVKELV